jgi:hypothetical protein
MSLQVRFLAALCACARRFPPRRPALAALACRRAATAAHAAAAAAGVPNFKLILVGDGGTGA